MNVIDFAVVYISDNCAQSDLSGDQVLKRVKGKRFCVNGGKSHQGGPSKISEAVHRNGRVCPDVDKIKLPRINDRQNQTKPNQVVISGADGLLCEFCINLQQYNIILD